VALWARGATGDTLSTKETVAMAVYPDSNKVVGIWPLAKLFRIDDDVDYWVGEA
jgi:hypothetical protein